MMAGAGSFVVDGSHPAVPGHFPGRPIVPGVVLLDHVAALRLEAGQRVTGFPSVRFLRPVRPGNTVVVAFALAAHDGGAFTCTVDGVAVLTGRLELAA